jgi:hypothetical protein
VPGGDDARPLDVAAIDGVHQGDVGEVAGAYVESA